MSVNICRARVGLLLSKVAPEHVGPLFLRYLNFPAEIYRRGGDYTAVFCFNLHPEIAFIKKHTGAGVMAIGVEPHGLWTSNYDPGLVRLCDVYVGYRKLDEPEFHGRFIQWHYPAGTRDQIAAFDANIDSDRPHRFGMFARHDPNIRREIADVIRRHDGVCAGSLFGASVADKMALQRQLRYEFITENEINDWYMSEKLGQALLAGCVPVYYGCTRAADWIPAHLFINMRDFGSVQDVVKFCLSAGVYEKYHAAIRRDAKAILESRFSWEGNVIEPLREYHEGLQRSGRLSLRRSFTWRVYKLLPTSTTSAGTPMQYSLGWPRGCGHRRRRTRMDTTSVKACLGCWIHERWRTECALNPVMSQVTGIVWQDLCNRHEAVARCGDGIGRVCGWKDSSFLTVCRLFPRTGGRLLQRCWSQRVPQPRTPVSIILPVRGAERAETVAFVASELHRMAGADSEVLICEHDVVARYDRGWPEGVRHVFVQSGEGEAFNKSRAMNAGARAACHPLLALHDADVFPSPDYLFCSLGLLAVGWEAARPVRFLFLLDEANSRTLMRQGFSRDLRRIPGVHQNFPGVATVIQRDVYFDMGGHDERFAGWGGEDIEFLDRLRTRKLYPGSFLPAIHLWHSPAEQKMSGHRNAQLLESILQEPRHQRGETILKKLRHPA